MSPFHRLALVGLSLLALGPQAALSTFDFVTFSSVLQCTPFSIEFSGGQLPSALPLKLTVVPLDSTPFSVNLPASSWNATTGTGHAITFIPFPAGTEFVASLDDANGAPAGLTSDVIKVGPFNSTFCLHSEQSSSANADAFVVTGELSQCEPFSVGFNTSEVTSAPSVRAFTPGGTSFLVNQSSSNTGTATYVMDALQGTKVILLVSDNSGLSETSSLLTVGGSDESSGTCIPSTTTSGEIPSSTPPSNSTMYTSSSTTAMSMEETNRSQTLSQGSIIAIAAVSGTVVVVIVLAMAFWLYWSRRKASKSAVRYMEQGGPYTSRGEKEILPEPPKASSSTARPSIPPAGSTWSLSSARADETTGYVKNPLYTNSNLWLSSPTTPGSASRRSNTPRSSTFSSRDRSAHSSTFAIPLQMSSPLSPLPQFADASASRTTPLPISRSQTLRSTRSQRGVPTSPTTTISTVDIEHILDMTERYSAGDSTDPAIPPLPRNVLMDQETVRMSAYLAGREVTHSPALPATPPGVHVRVRPPTLALGHSATSSLYSLRSPAGTHGRSPSMQVYREPPQALVPSSPMQTPLPSPL
ncbi:uncharacterized protein FIBRA_04575 [Fibroporia radiculosa]|uniref:Mid2 domain-containing protein n=1 Tax=Fibroporia radiculosa TaxID=599839 RepID=J4GPH2_9APHY|nr:uncharacterized protein FIBRA_04575 [Fibroporia radiculosa]CCM02475.1 predicted protein [Fibroporia radiculosa]